VAREGRTGTDSPEAGNGRASVTPRATRTRAEARAERLAKREEVRRQQLAANWRRRWLPWIIVAALVVLGIVGAIVYINTSPTTQPIPGLERYSGLSREHAPGQLTFPQMPPVGGTHNNVWMNCGVYDLAVATELAVHSMEHGAVWLTYRLDLPADQVQAIRNLARGQSYVLVSPWAGDPPLPAPIVASAWGLQIKVDDASDWRLAEFVRRYANGPQTPEPGAVCYGGNGTPMQNP
jgi:Protein of unknown function (DUF3105)